MNIFILGPLPDPCFFEEDGQLLIVAYSNEFAAYAASKGSDFTPVALTQEFLDEALQEEWSFCFMTGEGTHTAQEIKQALVH